jgi:hypothetical protein
MPPPPRMPARLDQPVARLEGTAGTGPDEPRLRSLDITRRPKHHTAGSLSSQRQRPRFPIRVAPTRKTDATRRCRGHQGEEGGRRATASSFRFGNMFPGQRVRLHVCEADLCATVALCQRAYARTHVCEVLHLVASYRARIRAYGLSTRCCGLLGLLLVSTCALRMERARWEARSRQRADG